MDFREDRIRVQPDLVVVNLVTLRHLSLNLLQCERAAKVGTKAKRFKVGWSERYLERLLTT